MKVINIGSLNIDRTYSVKEFVRPKETIKALKYEEHCGGKGLNQTIALRKAGANVYHAGIIGHDGQMLINELKAADASTEYIKMTDGNSGHAMIQVDEKGENNIIIHGGTNDHISKEFMRDAGSGVLLVSSDLNEILGLSDSLLVMFEGKIVAYIPDTSKLTEEELGSYMLGAKKQTQEEIKEAQHE